MPSLHPFAMLAPSLIVLNLCGLVAATPRASDSAGVVYYEPAPSHSVTFDERSAIIDGQPTLMLSGAVHYTRVHQAEWGRVFALAAEMGLNTIQTYVFWNAHETDASQVGNPNWAGRANLTGFIAEAASHGLWVNLRIGPYICGEYYFGGIPVWMRESGAECFRCSDPIWEREMARWVGVVVDKVRPQLATAGGNIVMLQIENEYSGGGGAGGNDQGYLDWSVDMARNLTTDVPWELCHDIFPCTKVNTNNATGKYEYKAICTINGFWMDVHDRENYQPSPKWMGDLQAGNPGQPWIWTEDQGWFDQWGVAKRVRDSRDQLYGIARFFARGGSWHNFYMLTGGNNYGKLSGGTVTTAYAPDTVIDFLLLRHQPRFDYYARFFRALANVSSEMVASSVIPAARPLVPTSGHGSHSNATASVAHCTDDDPSHVGFLDPSQQWQPSRPITSDKPFVLTNVGLGLCLDPLGTVNPPSLTTCGGASGTASQDLQWTYSATTQQFASVGTRACQASDSASDKQCHVCLAMNAAGNVNLWDCMTEPGHKGQLFDYDPKTSGITEGVGTAVRCLTATATGGGGAEVSVYGSVAFLSNMDDLADAALSFGGHAYYLPNHTVAIVRQATGEVVFNSSELHGPEMATATSAPPGGRGVGFVAIPAAQTAGWQAYQETPAVGTRTKASKHGALEQLHLAGGQASVDDDAYYSDYMWYTTAIPRSATGEYSVQMRGRGGAVLYVYVDGELLPSTSPWQPHHDAGTEDAHSALGMVVGNSGGDTSSPVTLQVLSVAMGLSNGGVGPQSTKGLTSATVNGVDVTNSSWTSTWLMSGEADHIWKDNITGGGGVAWKPAGGPAGPHLNSTLTWFRTTFDLPAAPAGDKAGAPMTGPVQVSYALSLVGANKGMAFVNGFELGRYWLAPGGCNGACAPPIKNGHCYMHWSDCGEPTQTQYHVPTPVLKPTGNVVVIFEETANVATRDLDQIQLLRLQAHP